MQGTGALEAQDTVHQQLLVPGRDLWQYSTRGCLLKAPLPAQVEQEEEFITMKLMKRLADLKTEKETLANEVEQEEEFLINNLQKRLTKLNSEKADLEKQLETEQVSQPAPPAQVVGPCQPLSGRVLCRCTLWTACRRR